MAEALLRLHDVKKYFPLRRGWLRRPGWLRAVDGVSFEVQTGEIFGLVGESGCGKTTLGKTILGLYRPTAGAITFKGRPIHALPPAQARALRREIQYVYQDPGASLDPWWTVGRSLHEPLVVHTRLSRRERQARVEEMIHAVGLESAHLRRYPHEFSGGQQRRLGLARVLVLNPSLVIFDEPTSGLDVSVQATILKLFKELRARFRLTYVFISHDLSVIRLMCQRVAVMYLGVVVELGSTAAIFDTPRHPYTRALLAAIPRPVVAPEGDEGPLLEGEPPSAQQLPGGCRFRLRCPLARQDPCARLEPPLAEVAPGHWVACHFADTVPSAAS
ncbi:MAG: ABC transporter ATP-binding protein [Candidatus Tectimicrobiota bacterium]|nr:MAG: ABC transporter ATP-binding protein [Candidatus Tectomicrobia bacterium]